MGDRIVYQKPDGGVAVIIPAPEYADNVAALSGLVPSGASWRIMDDAMFPPRADRDNWRWTESGPLDVAGG